MAPTRACGDVSSSGIRRTTHAALPRQLQCRHEERALLVGGDHELVARPPVNAANHMLERLADAAHDRDLGRFRPEEPRDPRPGRVPSRVLLVRVGDVQRPASKRLVEQADVDGVDGPRDQAHPAVLQPHEPVERREVGTPRDELLVRRRA